ncbi:hypothetical protein GCM10011506_09020 [Marivirga lumbricoides]|uniref:Peptidase metallopeptidase domain-containing protein n=1 Tax=Marivirga lumbricoides TaxID=1046115 RepID=A0ABQ1LJV1_9BACT|nr:hypothetical protein GCM10011506_09020 [Marivirga lumbricoides]
MCVRCISSILNSIHIEAAKLVWIKLSFVIYILLLSSCSKEISIINESDAFAICNANLSSCAQSPQAAYCLFGYKWGADQNFDQSGINAVGPQTSGGTITFSFQEKNGTINTHRQINVPSESWKEILSCAQKEIRKAILEWQEVADITFQELPQNSNSDIQFYTAAIFQSAVAFPNFTDTSCKTLSGDVIFNANSKEKSCNAFYINALHEIGHVLGLGHVNSSNIMAPDESKFDLPGLQKGDISGIQQIYGKN